MNSFYGVTEQEVHRNDLSENIEELKLNGFTVLESYLTSPQLEELNEAYKIVKEKNDILNESNNINFSEDLTIIRCPLVWENTFIEVSRLAGPLEIIKALLGDNIQLLMQNIITIEPGQLNEQSKYHRDLNYQHFVSSRPIALNFLITLDDFTSENGATFVLPGSHLSESFPSEQYIKKYEVQLEAPKGSAIVMDAMLYHRAGSKNLTYYPRRAVNHVVGRPFLAQQIDIPSYLYQVRGVDFSNNSFLSGYLGYKWSPAKSVVEWRRKRGG